MCWWNKGSVHGMLVRYDKLCGRCAGGTRAQFVGRWCNMTSIVEGVLVEQGLGENGAFLSYDIYC